MHVLFPSVYTLPLTLSLRAAGIFMPIVQLIQVIYMSFIVLQPESDGSRSGSSLSLRNIPPAVTQGNAQSPSHSHRGVHRSISATNAKPSRRASSGGETLRESQQQQQGTATGGGLSFHIFMECSVTPRPLPDALFLSCMLITLQHWCKL